MKSNPSQEFERTKAQALGALIAVLCMLAVVVAILAFFDHAVSKLRAENTALAQQVEKLTEELKQSEDFYFDHMEECVRQDDAYSEFIDEMRKELWALKNAAAKSNTPEKNDNPE